MAMALHALPDHRAVEYVEGGKQCGGAMPLSVVRRGAGPALLQRPALLGAVERLDLQFLVDRQHDGMGRRLDVEADNFAQLGDDIPIVGGLELTHPVRLQAVCAPDALHRSDTDPDRLRHRRSGSVRGVRRRLGEVQLDDPFGHLPGLQRDARGPGFVAQQPLHARLGEALLPAPNAGLRRAGLTHASYSGTDWP